MDPMNLDSEMWLSVLAIVILWWLFSAAVLFVCWNHVITIITSAKRLSFWHALLLVFTLGVLLAPHQAQRCWQGTCQNRMYRQMPMEEGRMNPSMMDEHMKNGPTHEPMKEHHKGHTMDNSKN